MIFHSSPGARITFDPPPRELSPYDFLDRLQGPKTTADFCEMYSCAISAQGSKIK